MYIITISFLRFDCLCQLSTQVDLFSWSNAEVGERNEVPNHRRVDENILLE
jgi:hypothetical protein